MKLQKQGGIDLVSNEMIKYVDALLVLPLVYLFNLTLQETVFSLFKKDDSSDCNNLRGISLCRSFGKLFTSLLNQKLYKCLDKQGFQSKFQAGFRPDDFPTDHLFAIKTIINKYVFHLKKHLYFCFIDFSKGFDSVDRKSLFYKLLKAGI